MGRVWRKVKSRSGASLMFAILVFMLCVLAGTAALTAAAANSGRYTHLRGEQQMYLAVNSAAKLMENQLVGKNFTATKETTTGAHSPSITSNNFDATNCIFSDWLKNYFADVFGGTATGNKTKNYEINLDVNSDSVNDIPTVKVKVTAGTDYRVEIVLSVEVTTTGATPTTTKYYETSVTLIPTVTTDPPVVNTTGGVTTTTETITVTWEQDKVTVREA